MYIGKLASGSQSVRYVGPIYVIHIAVSHIHHIQGTWQFMSVALLSETKSIEISDELEAFFYVILYHAARYLHSDVDGFMLADYLDAFFDQYTKTPDGWTCGNEKRMAIESGKLTIAKDEELQFDGPMGHIIATLLSWFQSYYIVTKHNRRLEEEKKRQEAEAPQKSSLLNEPRRAPGKPKYPRSYTGKLFSAVEDSAANWAPKADGQPSPEDWRDWKNVTTHFHIVKLLELQLDKSWPPEDKVGDRIPKTWVRRVLSSTASLATRTTSSNKRARVERKASLVTTFPIPPSQQPPPQSPPRRGVSSPDAFWINQAGDPESLPP